MAEDAHAVNFHIRLLVIMEFGYEFGTLPLEDVSETEQIQGNSQAKLTVGKVDH